MMAIIAVGLAAVSTFLANDGWRISLACAAAGRARVAVRVMAGGKARYADAFGLTCVEAAVCGWRRPAA